MKTITEYRPLIFGVIRERAREREINRRALSRNFSIATAYALVGFWLMLDLGSIPTEWQFWVVFGPLLVVGEIVIVQSGSQEARRNQIRSQ